MERSADKEVAIILKDLDAGRIDKKVKRLMVLAYTVGHGHGKVDGMARATRQIDDTLGKGGG